MENTNRRNVVVYIGISLDGYIATREDSLDWLLNTPGEGDNGFGAFYDTVDTILMGKRTYDWIMEQEQGRFPYVGKECYVYTRQPPADTEHVRFTRQSPAELMAGMAGRTIWVVGGSQLIELVRQQGLVDEYILNVAPVILGDGIPLFCPGTQEQLVFQGMQRFGQFAELRYQVQKKIDFHP